MPNIPPPPVPACLRERLKDYPEYLERVQEVLIQSLSKAGSGIPVFEQAIWALEGRLETFMMEASDELEATIASGDADAIEKAKKKDLAVGAARMNLYLPDLFDYFKTYYPTGYAERGAA